MGASRFMYYIGRILQRYVKVNMAYLSYLGFICEEFCIQWGQDRKNE